MPVDTLFRTSIISSSIVLLLNPFANLSLGPLSLFSIYGPDLGVWPDCWVSAEFLRAPIPRKGSGSTTTTTITGNLRSISVFPNNTATVCKFGNRTGSQKSCRCLCCYEHGQAFIVTEKLRQCEIMSTSLVN